MKNIMEELFEQYNNFSPDMAVQQEIEDAHQELISNLEKANRMLVLRIIDNKDSIAGDRAKESFECGFWLAWRLFTQLNIYDSGYLHEDIFNADGNFFIKKGDQKDENKDWR